MLYGIAAAANVHPYFNSEVALWVLILATVIALVLGGFVGMLLARLRPPPKVDDPDDLEKLQRLRAYTAHFQTTLGRFLSNDLSLTGILSTELDEGIGQVICEFPANMIEQATGVDTKISLWTEKQVDDDTRFELIFDGDHSGKERRQFHKINASNSWLHHSVERRKCTPGESPVLVMHLADSSDGSSDIQAFRSMGYRDGRAFGIDIDGQSVLFVVLSKQENTFSESEDLFFIQLWCVLVIATEILAGRGKSLPQTSSHPAE